MRRRRRWDAVRGSAVRPLLLGAAREVTRIRLPVGAGNPFDVSPRVLPDLPRQVTGQSWIVENKRGAGGTIAALEVSRATPLALYVSFHTRHRHL